MAWTAPRTWANGVLVTAAMMNTDVRDNELFLRGFHGARMLQVAALSTINTTFQLITWDTMDYDTDGFGVLGSEWFVIPTGMSGYYRVSGIVSWAGNATGIRQVKLMKNETYTVRAGNSVGSSIQLGPSIAGGVASTVAVTLGWQGPLVAGDHLTLECWQSSGTTLAFNTGADSMAIELCYLGN